MAKPSTVQGLGAATPMREASRAWMAARLADVERHRGSVQSAQDPKAVHDTRVATRRLRAALRLFGRGAKAAKADRAIRRLQDALGEVRDLDVQQHAFETLAAIARGRELAVMGEIRRQLGAQRADRLEALAAAVTRWSARAPGVLRSLQSLRPKGKLGGHRLRRKLVEGIEDLEERVNAALEDPSPLPVHELRIALKRFRYELEFLEPAMPDETAEIREALVPLQEGLGNLHDADVRVAWVDGLNGTNPAGTAALRQRLQAERDRLEREVTSALEHWEAEAVALRAEVLLGSSPLKRSARPRAADRR